MSDDFSQYAKGLRSVLDPGLSEFPKLMFSDDLRNRYKLPPKIDYSYVYPKVDNQGYYGTCVAHGIKKIFEFFYRKRKGNDIIISADAIFSTAKHRFYPNDLTDDGIQISDGLKILMEFYVLDADMPYLTDSFQECLRPVPEDKKKTDYLFQNYFSVNPDIESMKLALYHHGPLAIGIMWQKEWNNTNSKGQMQGQNTTPEGGHCVAIVGYNDEIENLDGTKGAFNVINNWGTGWARGGYAWLPYNSQTMPMTIYTIQA